MIHLEPCQPADEVAKLLSINFYVPPAQPFARKGLTASLPFPALSGCSGGPAVPWVLAHSKAHERNCLMPRARLKNPPQPKNNPSLSSESPKGSSFHHSTPQKSEMLAGCKFMGKAIEPLKKTFSPATILGRFWD